MTTTGEQLVILSELPGVETAMTHFLAIDTSGSGGPSGTYLVGEVDVQFEPAIIGISNDAGLIGILDDVPTVVVENDDIEIEVGDDGLTGETC